MSSYDGGGFQEWVEDIYRWSSHPNHKKRIKRVMQLFQPWAASIQRACDDFDCENQSWRDYRNSLMDYIPEHIQEEGREIMSGNSIYENLPDDVRFGRHFRKPTTLRLDFGDDYSSLYVAIATTDSENDILEHIRAAMRSVGIPT